MRDILRKIVRGDEFRKSRLHDEQGAMVPILEVAKLPLRLIEAVLAKLNILSHEPWWPRAAARKICLLGRGRWTVVEFGSGMSTLWLADRFNSVISVESNRDWYKRISSKLIDRTNVKYLYRESSCYTDIPALSQIDLVVIDGDRRADCIDWAMARLKPGAWLYLDNSDADKDHVPGQPNRTFLARHKLLQLASEGRLSLETFRGFPPACLVASEGILARVSA